MTKTLNNEDLAKFALNYVNSNQLDYHDFNNLYQFCHKIFNKNRYTSSVQQAHIMLYQFNSETEPIETGYNAARDWIKDFNYDPSIDINDDLELANLIAYLRIKVIVYNFICNLDINFSYLSPLSQTIWDKLLAYLVDLVNRNKETTILTFNTDLENQFKTKIIQQNKLDKLKKQMNAELHSNNSVYRKFISDTLDDLNKQIDQELSRNNVLDEYADNHQDFEINNEYSLRDLYQKLLADDSIDQIDQQIKQTFTNDLANLNYYLIHTVFPAIYKHLQIEFDSTYTRAILMTNDYTSDSFNLTSSIKINVCVPFETISDWLKESEE